MDDPEIRVIDEDVLVDLHEDLVTLAVATGGNPMGPWDAQAAAGWSAIAANIAMRVNAGAYSCVAETAAAFLCHGATTQHLFDGTKRMSTAAMNAQLMWNGYELVVDDNTMASFTMLVSMTRSTDLDEVVRVTGAFIDRNIAPYQPRGFDPFASRTLR